MIILYVQNKLNNKNQCSIDYGINFTITITFPFGKKEIK
jgi:hypothetical protein